MYNAIEQVLKYLNNSYQRVVNLNIGKYFNIVNHDKFISIIKERVNKKTFIRFGHS